MAKIEDIRSQRYLLDSKDIEGLGEIASLVGKLFLYLVFLEIIFFKF